MKEGKMYFDIKRNQLIQYLGNNGSEWNFERCNPNGKPILFYSFNPYPEFVRECTNKELKLRQNKRDEKVNRFRRR